jgi:hypothetical protein
MVAAQGPAGAAGGSVEGEPQDEVPQEWLDLLEERRAAQQRREREQTQTLVKVAQVVGGVLAAGVLITIAVLAGSKPLPAPAAMPATVQQFAKALPPSQRPNAAGVAIVDGTDAPNTWRVAWVTVDAAFCFAFVHQGTAAQTDCDAAGSVDSAKMRIAGVLEDDGLNPPEPFACGYTTGDAGYVEINDGQVVGDAADIGSGFSGYCLQLPDGWTPGTSFTVSTEISGENADGKSYSNGVCATYP